MKSLLDVYHNGGSLHLYYYRDTAHNQVDLIIEAGDTLYPVEFKKTVTLSKTAAKDFHLLEKLGNKIGPGAVIPLSREVIGLSVGYL